MKSLTKRFDKNGPEVVDGFSLDIPAGMVYGLLGPNGAGKTTIVRMLSTLLKPTSGTATVNGYDVVTQASEVKEGEHRRPAGGHGTLRQAHRDRDATVLRRGSRRTGSTPG
jgi:ABC-type uncharacterized transport system ATPase subunit